MKKKVLSLLLTVVMLLSLLPVAAFADGPAAAENTAPEAVTAQEVESAEAPASAEEASPAGLTASAEPVPAVGTPIQIDTYQAEYHVSDPEPENKDLFMGYLYQASGMDPEKAFAPEHPVNDPYTARQPAMGYQELNATNQKLFESLVPHIQNIAANGGITQGYAAMTDTGTYDTTTYRAQYNDTELRNFIGYSEPTSYHAIYESMYGSEENFIYQQVVQQFCQQVLGIDPSQFNAYLNDLMTNKLNWPLVLNRLIASCPYELYWFDKTVGAQIQTELHVTYEGNMAMVSFGLIVTFEAAQAYRGAHTASFTMNNTTVTYHDEVDTAKITGIPAAVERAASVVTQYQELNDYEKLKAYLDWIDNEVDYNNAAYSNSNTPYGDPWQLIWVFDNDPATKVVCEGYAKAFKYLCDLSTWTDDGMTCYLVSGNMTGGTGAGPHMWDIVHIGGGNYLVDPTNCDNGSVGENHGLFMQAPGSGNASGGYVFTNTNPNITFVYDNDTKATYTADELTLSPNAYTPPTYYTVTFDAQGHGTAPANKSIAEGDKIAKPADLTATGFTFGGWFKEPACTNAWNFTSDAVTGAVTLYAKWTVTKQTITYKANGGSGTMEPQQADYGTNAPILECAFTRDDYRFVSWNTQADGKGTTYHVGDTVPLTADMNLFAQWTPLYTLTFDKNKGAGDDMEVLKQAKGDVITLPANTYIRDGYTFVGWSTYADGPVAYTDGGSYTVDEFDTILYAKWEENVAGLKIKIDYVDDLAFSVEKPANYPINDDGYRWADGYFYFTALENNDEYTITFKAPGYVDHVLEGTYDDGAQTAIDVKLAKFCDLNCDSLTDIQDMACLFTFLTDGTRQGGLKDDEAYFNKVADFNGDGAIDILDYQAMYQRINHPASAMKVAVVTSGPVNGGDFNQITYDTARSWATFNGAAFANYVSEDENTKIEQAISDGCNVVILTGFTYAFAVEEIADDHPDVKFICLDFTTENAHSNVYCAAYREEQAGFLAGYAAVKMGYDKLGFLGGLPVDSVKRYGLGFVQGAEAAAKADGKTGVEVKYVYANTFDPEEDDPDNLVANTVYDWYRSGTQVVFSCGGKIWNSAAAASISAANKEEVSHDTYKIIGVDMDQRAEINDTYGADLTVTSAMKDLAGTVNTQLQRIKDGAFVSGNDNLGLVSSVNPAANFVQLPLNSTQWNETFTQADYKAILADLVGATPAVTVSDDTSKAPGAYADTITVSVQESILPPPPWLGE